MAYATPEDVADRLGRDLDEQESRIVEARLGDAELKLRNRIPDLDSRVAASADYEATVIMVEAEMILRLVKNPDGFAEETDGNYSYRLSSQVASGRLEVLDEEWAELGVRRGAFTLHPTFYQGYGDDRPLLPYTMNSAIRDGWA
jgi:hypothetical protein